MTKFHGKERTFRLTYSLNLAQVEEKIQREEMKGALNSDESEMIFIPVEEIGEGNFNLSLC